ncbi:MAG: UDP-N-acetylglucosamine 2-epimerase (non-hydrolyzing) [Candidatus Bipolaricaulota bacterium]
METLAACVCRDRVSLLARPWCGVVLKTEVAGRPVKVVTVVGARPQFVKAAVVSPALRASGIEEILVHTGQHYDAEMSAVFFEGLDLPDPSVNLGVGSASHGAQTARMMEGIEAVLLREHPCAVLVYGDTNSTLAGALAAVKLHIPVAHVEAGLRSFDRRMPEEINRVLTDHASSLLFAPTEAAVHNLAAEGITRGVVRTGDVMFELLETSLPAVERAREEALEAYGLRNKRFVLATIHRAENTDDANVWPGILEALRRVAADIAPVIWPAHPRVRALLEKVNLPGVSVIAPLPYLQTQVLARLACLVLTDSGGLQKEAAFHGTPCLVLRDRTEWVELVEDGGVLVAGTDAPRIVECATLACSRSRPPRFEGAKDVGIPSRLIAETLLESCRGLSQEGEGNTCPA